MQSYYFLLRYRGVVASLVLVLLIAFVANSYAKPTTKEQALSVASGWLKSHDRPMGRRFGSPSAGVETTTENGKVLYHTVRLQGGGFVIISGDDEIQPVIAFSSDGTFTHDPDSPLTVLLEKDMAARIGLLKQKFRQMVKKIAPNRKKWDEYTKIDEQPPMLNSSYPSAISDVWVEPLVQSQWGQDKVCDLDCYNRFTPPDSPENTNQNITDHYVCGCVATAVSQIMRYHSYPDIGIGVQDFEVQVDYSDITLSTIGGDGAGGPYNWELMPFVPDCSLDEDTLNAQFDAIGALCYDVGLAVHMSYTSGGSGAYSMDAQDALLNVFHYGNAIYANNYPSNIGEPLKQMVNPNLDASLPVYLGISGYGGHAIVCDGYGYNDESMYHHLNMGWNGQDNLWYQLPDMGDFSVVDECIYNIYPNGTGEIISGRVLNLDGDPIASATVTASDSQNTYQAVTNEKGIYAITHLPSNADYTISVNATGYTPAAISLHIGESISAQLINNGATLTKSIVTGNKWGVNFDLQTAGPHPDQYENDNTPADAGIMQPNAAPQFHSIYPVGDVDYIKVNISRISLVTIETAGDVNIGIKLQLFKADDLSKPIKSYTNIYAMYASLRCILDEGGYYLKVQTADAGGYIEQYTVTISADPINIDLNNDYVINYADLMKLIERWLDVCGDANDWCGGADIDSSGLVDYTDYRLMNSYWQDELFFLESFESGDMTKWNWNLDFGDKPWGATSAEAYDGNYSAKSDDTITSSETSAMQITIDSTYNTISYYRKIAGFPDEDDHLNFYIDDRLMSSSFGEDDWKKFSYTLIPGKHTFKWLCEKGTRDPLAAWVDKIKMVNQYADLSYFDFEKGYFDYSGFYNYGDYQWTFCDGSVYPNIEPEPNTGGTYCLRTPRSMRYNDATQCDLDLEIDNSATIIKFYIKVSSEQNYDKLSFYIDRAAKGDSAEPVAEWSGDIDWTEVQFPITPGSHVYTWEYKKDGSTSKNYDTAWIDNIQFTD